MEAYSESVFIHKNENNSRNCAEITEGPRPGGRDFWTGEACWVRFLNPIRANDALNFFIKGSWAPTET